MDSSSKAKEILRENLKKNSKEGAETNFLAGVIDKFEKEVDTDSNDPMQAISGLMQSGMITGLINDMHQGMQSGELDIGKLMGSVQGMIGAMSDAPGLHQPPEVNAKHSKTKKQKAL